MIGFVVALKSEVRSFLEKTENISESSLAGKPLFTGKYLGEDVAIIISDIGKVSAALSAQALIDRYSPELIFNFGTAGAIKGKAEVLSYYFIDKSAQYDLDLTALEPVPLGFNQGYGRVFFDSLDLETDLEKRTLASSDKFTSERTDIDKIEKMGCSLFDMEGAAIAQVALSNGVPFISVKGISDLFGSGSNAEQFAENLSVIGKNFPAVIEKVLKAFLEKQ